MKIRTLLFLGCLTGASLAQSQDQIFAGIFTEAQVTAGEALFRARCVSCHGVDLRGNSNSPSLLGLSFLFLWEGRSLGELFTKMRTAMPTDNPGSLPAQSYADILAYILSVNGYPPGTAELGTDVAILEKIPITAPP